MIIMNKGISLEVGLEGFFAYLGENERKKSRLNVIITILKVFISD